MVAWFGRWIAVLTLAVLLSGSLPAREPEWGEVVPSRQFGKATGALSEVGSTFAEDLSGRLPAEFADSGVGKIIGSALGGVLPGGMGKFVGSLAGNFAWKVAYDYGSGKYGEKVKGAAPTKIDWGEAGAAALGGAILGSVLGAVAGPLGGTIGTYVGWSLGTEILRELRSGQKFSISRVLKNADILGSAVEGAAVAVGVGLAGKLLGGVAAGPLGTVAKIGLGAVFASLAASITSVAMRHMRASTAENDDPGWERPLSARAPPIADGAGSGALRMDAPATSGTADSYRNFLRLQRERPPGDSALGEAHQAYVRAVEGQRAARARAAAHR